MKRGLVVISLAVGITFTIILGIRISTDALAVIVGVALGILASVPTTVIVMFIITRQQSRLQRFTTQASQPPPVIVVNAADRNQPYLPPALPASTPASGPRKWTVIGDEETDVMAIGD